MSEHPALTLICGKLADAARPFVIIAELEAESSRGSDVAAAIAQSQVLPRSRLEPGCIAYDMCRGIDVPNRFVVRECWRNLAALQHHLETAHFAAFGAALAGLLATPLSIRVFTPLDDPR